MKSPFSNPTNNKIAFEIVRYGLVGILTNVISYFLYLIATHFGVGPKIAMSILYFTAATLSFWANKRWTFFHTGNLITSGSRYIISHCIGYMTNLLILIIMIDNLGYDHRWSQGLSIIAVSFILFLLAKFFVFSEPSPKKP